ncbi:hypothetical protein [Pseudomonas sp. RC10]|uniref:hypothetical protein n=1 Tax=Pseudomonas bambusae TaxID=3139142 RepID=UPI003139440E
MNATEVIQAIDGMTPAAQQAYLSQISDSISAATLAEVQRAIEQHDDNKVMALLPVGLFAGFVELLRSAFVRGGSTELRDVRVVGLLIGREFDAYDTDAANFLRDQRTGFLATAAADRASAIRAILEAGRTRGQSASTTAMDLIGRVNKQTGRRSGGVLGLSAPFTQAVIAARAELSSNDPAQLRKYLKRGRRDPIFDKAVRTALEFGKRLTADSINTIVDRYSERLLDTQALNAATTFLAQSIAEGRDQAWRQANDRADNRLLVTKTWNSKGDAHVRSTHVALNKQKVQQDQPFVSPSGARLMYPGDTSLGAPRDEIVNCRCAAEYSATRIDR